MRMDKDRELSRVPNPRGRIRRKKFVPANRRQRISAGFCAPPNCADASAVQNSFPPTVGNEFPPVSALPRTARTYPPHKISSRKPSARNFRRFLRSPNPRGRIYRKKFVAANRRQGISAGFCLFQTRADASTAQNSFPPTGGKEFPPVFALPRTAREIPASFLLVLTFNGNRYTIYNMSTISESSKSRKGSLIRHFQE